MCAPASGVSPGCVGWQGGCRCPCVQKRNQRCRDEQVLADEQGVGVDVADQDAGERDERWNQYDLVANAADRAGEHECEEGHADQAVFCKDLQKVVVRVFTVECLGEKRRAAKGKVRGKTIEIALSKPEQRKCREHPQASHEDFGAPRHVEVDRLQIGKASALGNHRQARHPRIVPEIKARTKREKGGERAPSKRPTRARRVAQCPYQGEHRHQHDRQRQAGLGFAQHQGNGGERYRDDRDDDTHDPAGCLDPIPE